MKKRFFGLLLGITMLIVSSVNTQAFAMNYENALATETTTLKKSVCPLNTTESGYVFDKTLTYGQSSYIGLFEPFRNKENFAIVKLKDDNRTHRVILKVAFSKLTSRALNHNNEWIEADNGLGDVKLGIYVSINGGNPITFFHNAYEEQPWQFQINNVPKGATLTIVVDAFTSDMDMNNGNYNGNYRSINISYLEGYFD